MIGVIHSLANSIPSGVRAAIPEPVKNVLRRGIATADSVFTPKHEVIGDEPQKLVTGKRELPDFPNYLCLEVTNACNLRCVQCMYQGTATDHYIGGPGILDTDLAKDILKQLGTYGCSVMLNGDGEPLLHPNFLEIAEFASKQNLPKVYFNTNGTKFTPEFTDRLIQFFKGDVQFSLDGLKESHERIRVGSNYEKTIGNIDYLIRRVEETGAPIGVQVNYCRYDQPEGELEEFIKHWLDRVESVNTCVVYDYDYKIISGWENDVTTDERVMCGVPWETFIIRWNGTVVPCSNCFTKGYDGNFVFGNAKMEKLKDIWVGDAYQSWRDRTEKWDLEGLACDSCDRWNMYAHADDEVNNGVKITRTGVFTTYQKLADTEA